jgi:hypothetical protein
MRAQQQAAAALRAREKFDLHMADSLNGEAGQAGAVMEAEQLLNKLTKVEKRGKVIQGALLASLVFSGIMMSPLSVNQSASAMGNLSAAAKEDAANGLVRGVSSGTQNKSPSSGLVAMQSMKLDTQLKSLPIRD